MKRLLLVLSVVILAASCESNLLLDVPEFRNGGFLGQSNPLPDSGWQRLEGVWRVRAGSDRFGDSVAIRVSGDRLTVYGRPNVVYAVLDLGYLDSLVVLEGYWREQVNANTGLVRLVVPKTGGGGWVIYGGQRPENLQMAGTYGFGNGNPATDLLFEYVRPFSENAKGTFFNIAHRGGGRTADRIPHSENTVELIRIAERFGSNAVEIDVKLSSDGVPFLYHDTQLNPRLTRRGALVGKPESYPWPALRQYVTLIRGEKMPTLQEALETIVDETNLEFIYLDTKTKNAGLISRMIPIINAAVERANGVPGRAPFRPFIGLPSQDTYNEFRAIDGHENIPSLCELSLDQAREIDADVWGPRWTLGTQNDLVLQAQGEGMEVVTWTVDIDEFIEAYIRDGNFDGILTNYPTLVEYHWLMQP